MVPLRRFVPFLDPSVQNWSTEARLLHWLTFLWLSVGLVVLFSASYHVGMVESGDGLLYFKRQILWVILGLVSFYVAIHTPLDRLIKLARFAFFTLLVLIFATHLPVIGKSVNGASRWILLGPIPLQPSELMKPCLVLQSAAVFGRWSRITLRERLVWLLCFGVMLLGILIQPNLSTTALCGISLWLLALGAGIRVRQLGLTALGGIGLALISVFRNEYQQRRILSFMDPWKDAQGDGYQLSQSLLAVGSGRWTGAGFGLSQQKLSRVPFQHTDFIYSIFAEEFGLIGSLFLLFLTLMFSFLALRVAVKTVDPVRRLIGMGAMVILVSQALINVGVSTGVLPTTGLPLPLFSYGGSSMIASLALAGLLIRVARESQEADVVPISVNASHPQRQSRLQALPLKSSDRSPQRHRTTTPSSVKQRQSRNRKHKLQARRQRYQNRSTEDPRLR